MFFSERSMSPFGIQKAVEGIITKCMNDEIKYDPPRAHTMVIPSDDKSWNIVITCIKCVENAGERLVNTHVKIRKNDGHVSLTIVDTIQFKIDVEIEDNPDNSLCVVSFLPDSLDEIDMKRVIGHIMILAKTTKCFECGNNTSMAEGLCGPCLSKTTEQDFARDGTTDICAICLSCVDVPIYRKSTNCCKQLVHKKCCAAAVFANRKDGSNRLACFYCRSKKFHNTTYSLEDDDFSPYEGEDEDEDDDEDHYIYIC